MAIGTGGELPRKPFKAQSTSTINYAKENDEWTVTTSNVNYEVSFYRELIFRTSIRKRVGEGPGMDGAVALEAWRFGDDIGGKPIYRIVVDGIGAVTKDRAIWVVDRYTEGRPRWSVYSLITGEFLLESAAELSTVSTPTAGPHIPERYIGFQVPEHFDKGVDARLLEQHVVGLLTYARQEGVIREVLVTCDDPKRAGALHMLADQEWRPSVIEDDPSRENRGRRIQTLKLSHSGDPEPRWTFDILIPIVNGDLDLARAIVPAGLHLQGWKR
jgi:hypothetical protein